MLGKIRKYLLLLGLGLMILALISWQFHQDDSTRIVFLDVGQGDSIFIQTPQKRQILIDGGPSDGLVHKLGQVMPFFDRTIDVVVLTHPDADHITGLLEVLKRYEVEMVIENRKTEKSTAEYRLWRDIITARQIADREPVAGEKNFLEKDISLQWLTPWPGPALDATNDNSLVFIMRVADRSFLFTGDISSEVETRLLEQFCPEQDQCPFRDIDLLKVAHHGSSGSSHGDFINTVHPRYAIIQSGKENRFGHPQPVILKRLQNSGAAIYRNDLQGDITVKTDGRDIIITTER